MEYLTFILFLLSAIFVYGKSLECNYTSREYQIVLKPDIVSGRNTFSHGVLLVLDELDAMEQSGLIDFTVSRSSLKFKNITSAKYLSQSTEDLTMKITMKSRQKNTSEQADFVLKFSNADPNLACVPLTINNIYVDHTEMKFELDFHAVNGKVMTKSAMSYTVDMPSKVKFTQTLPVNLSTIFVNSAQKLTYSGRHIVGQPVDQILQETAEFYLRLSSTKIKASITLIGSNEDARAEFSFRIKDHDVTDQVLSTAQKLASELSRVSTIALFAGSNIQCGE